MNKHILLTFLMLILVSVERSSSSDEPLCKRKEPMDIGELTQSIKNAKSNADMKALLDLLVQAVTHAINTCSPKNMHFDDLEKSNSKGYLCGAGGLVYGMYTVMTKSSSYLGDSGKQTGPNDELEFKISYQYYSGTTVQFDKSYIDLSKNYNVYDKLSLHFYPFDMDITFKTIHMQDMLKQKQCIVHIKNFESSVKFFSHSLLESGYETASTQWWKKIKEMLSTEMKQVQESLINKVKASYYEGLVNSGDWICLDDHVEEVIGKKLISTRKTISTEDFNKNCGMTF